MAATVNTTSFAAARARLAQAQRVALAAIAEDLVQNTPVQEGWLRAWWSASYDGATVTSDRPAAPDPTGTETAIRLAGVAGAAPVGATITFTNGAPYAFFVEYGTSKMRPRAFVSGTVMRAPHVAARAFAQAPTTP